MALVFPGETRCHLCKRIIHSVDEVVGFPAFIPAGHEYADFSDAAFHKDCFLAWDKREELQRLYDAYQAIWNSRPASVRTLDEIDRWGKQAFDKLFAPGMRSAAEE